MTATHLFLGATWFGRRQLRPTFLRTNLAVQRLFLFPLRGLGALFAFGTLLPRGMLDPPSAGAAFSLPMTNKAATAIGAAGDVSQPFLLIALYDGTKR